MRVWKGGRSASNFSLRMLAAGAAGVSVASVAACGSSMGSSGASSSDLARGAGPATVPAPSSYFKNDNDFGDNDVVKGDEQELLHEYGVRLPRSEYEAVGNTVKRYMSLALAEDGTAACPMLYTGFRNALLELHGTRATGRSGTQACPALMTMEFRRHHSQLASYGLSTMVITDARVKNDGSAIALLGFRAAPEREILIAREGSNWKIDAILDSELP